MNSLKLALLTIFHPVDMLIFLKNQRDKIKYFTLPVLVLLFIAVRLAGLYVTNYPLTNVNPKDINLLLELGIILIPFFTWTISVYLITTIMDGEMKLTEFLTANCFCLLPYIFITVPISLLSNIMSLNDKGLFDALNIFVLLWVIVLLIVTVQNLNNYSFGRTIWISFLGIIGMVLIWCVIMLIAVLTIQFVCFIQSVIFEFRLSALK